MQNVKLKNAKNADSQFLISIFHLDFSILNF